MFDPTSRYANLPPATRVTRDADGLERTTVYVTRRFIPPLGAGISLVEHRVTEGERLDNITARYLGDPLQFWQVCDANGVLRPSELEAPVGRVVDIALPRL